MLNVRKPVFRPAGLVALAALGVVASWSVVAQGPRAQISLALAAGQAATPPALNPRHPDRYVVQRGDTLWDIAAMFLQDPWYWPEIWQINPQVENPHLIFPGDVLSLAYLSDGRPVVQLTRGSDVVERRSPQVRAYPLEEAISTIPYEALRAFLSRPAILDAAAIDALPYIVAQREGLMASAGRDVYVRGGDAPVGAVLNIVHVAKPLVDPDDDAVIGYEGVFVGRGRVDRTGDPATVRMLESSREALVGDYLMEEESVEPFTFLPSVPAERVEGRIVSVIDGVALIGQYQVVAINRGARDGLSPGHVLRVYRTGAEIKDPIRGRRSSNEKVRLPDEPAGTMMVFRSFDRMSYALVMEATDAIDLLATVRTP